MSYSYIVYIIRGNLDKEINILYLPLFVYRLRNGMFSTQIIPVYDLQYWYGNCCKPFCIWCFLFLMNSKGFTSCRKFTQPCSKQFYIFFLYYAPQRHVLKLFLPEGRKFSGKKGDFAKAFDTPCFNILLLISKTKAGNKTKINST